MREGICLTPVTCFDNINNMESEKHLVVGIYYPPEFSRRSTCICEWGREKVLCFLVALAVWPVVSPINLAGSRDTVCNHATVLSLGTVGRTRSYWSQADTPTMCHTVLQDREAVKKKYANFLRSCTVKKLFDFRVLRSYFEQKTPCMAVVRDGLPALAGGGRGCTTPCYQRLRGFEP